MRHTAAVSLTLVLSACSFNSDGLSGTPSPGSLSTSDQDGTESGELVVTDGASAGETQEAPSTSSSSTSQTSEISSGPSSTSSDPVETSETGSLAESGGTGTTGQVDGTSSEGSTTAEAESSGGESSSDSTGAADGCAVNADCPSTDVCYERFCHDARTVIYSTNATGFGLCSNNKVSYDLFIDDQFTLESVADYCVTEWPEIFMYPGTSVLRLSVRNTASCSRSRRRRSAVRCRGCARDGELHRLLDG